MERSFRQSNDHEVLKQSVLQVAAVIKLFFATQISRRVQFMFALYAIGVVLFLSMVSISLFARFMLDDIKLSLQDKGEFALGVIEQQVEQIEGKALGLAESSQLINGVIDMQGSSNYLPDTLENFARQDYIQSVSLVDYNGINIYSTNELISTDPERLWRVLQLGQQNHYLDDKQIVMMFPVVYYSTPQAALIFSVDLEQILKSVTDGIHNAEIELFPLASKGLLANGLVDEKLVSYLALEATSMPRLHALGLGAVSQVDSDYFYAPIHKLILWSAGVVIVSLIFSLLLGFLTGKAILKPVHTLHEKVVHSKDDKPLFPLGTGDELEELAQAFDHKSEALFRSKIELEKRHRLAVQANQSKSEFLANMSHELRTPMHAILSFTNLTMKNLGKPDKARGFLENILASGQRLTDLLNDLLDLSKLESGKMDVSFDEYPFAHCVEKVLGELAPLLQDKQLRLEKQLDDNLRVVYDAKLIMHVMLNIFSNAIKFSPNEDVIEVSACQVELENTEGEVQSMLQVSITDNGIGIPPEETDAVFDKFTQSSKTKSGAGGTGLGLAISREIIDLHHGQIWAESPPAGRDNGARFVFRIPLKQAT